MTRSIHKMTIVVLGLIWCGHANAAVRYVKKNATGANNGTSWANAYSEADGLKNAMAAVSSGDQVWVAQDTYDGPIALKTGVGIYGGFAGTETAASQSNPDTRPTTITGNDAGRVVTGSGVDNTAVLRGFHLIAGESGFNEGAAMELNNASPKIVRCSFHDNYTGLAGGALSVDGTAAAPSFINCKFHNNRSDIAAGGVTIRRGTPTFVNCLFYSNTALEGGAVFVDNWAAPVFTNCTFATNSTTIREGGALSDPEAKATFRNCIFWSNVAGGDTSTNQIYNHANYMEAVTYSDMSGGWTGTGNINQTPLFQSPSTGNYNIFPASPCSDAGSSSLLPADIGDLDWDGNVTETIPFDLAGVPRVQGTAVDMGAYEINVAEGEGE